jgi:hypothetical protein
MQLHYDGDKDHKSHELGIAVESPPAPATVANPPAMPQFGGYPIPPALPPQKTGSIGIDILLMKRSYSKAFWLWTGVVALLTAMAISSIFADIIIFRI